MTFHFHLVGPRDPATGLGIPLSPELAEATRIRFQECYDVARPYLRGAQGETIQIKLAAPGSMEAGQLSPLTISMEPSDIGIADTGHFNPELGCESVLHETLHHMGLADLYTFIYYDPNDTCSRSGGGNQSIMQTGRGMRDDSPMKRVALHSGGYVEHSCECPPWSIPGGATAKCIAKVAAIRGPIQACPAGTVDQKGIQFTRFMIAGSNLAKERLARARAQYGEGKQVGDEEYPRFKWIAWEEPSTTAPPTLIYPGEARAITLPACHEENRTYQACAYPARKPDGTCEPKPAICREPEAWVQ